MPVSRCLYVYVRRFWTHLIGVKTPHHCVSHRVLNAVEFDAVFVQFYNNACGLPNYNDANAWDFGLWDTWAKTVAPNKNVKVFIGALASSTAGTSGYVDATTLNNIALETRSKYSSFGGVMLWDASQAYGKAFFESSMIECPLTLLLQLDSQRPL